MSHTAHGIRLQTTSMGILIKGWSTTKTSPDTSTMGIDHVTSTFVGVSETTVMLRELVPDVAKFEKKIHQLEKYIRPFKKTKQSWVL